MYKYLFGPVPSRRLGMSLGVDLVPHKVCSLNCVYCECGRTTNLTLQRDEYVPFNTVTSEIKHYLGNQPAPDYITFSGSGEPTLNSRIGDVLHFIKKLAPTIPVAVLTNGTLFSKRQVRDELLDADLILPSLDAATDLSFRKINRPYHTLNLNKYIKGLIDFRQEYEGKIWLEVLILSGYNDKEKDLIQLRNAILEIQPDRIQLNTLDRPGAIENLRAATHAELQYIKDYWDIENVEIIKNAPDRKMIKSYRADMETAILETISRRPCTLEDITQILGIHMNETNKYLDVLEAEHKIEPVRQNRGLFYREFHGDNS